MKLLTFSLCLLLTACTHVPTDNERFVQFAEEIGGMNDYRYPITRDKYLLTVFGFYLARDVRLDKGLITYRAVYDNRPTAGRLQQQFDTNPNFDNYFPIFVEYVGRTDCQGQATAQVNHYRADFKTLANPTRTVGDNEVAQGVCLLREKLNSRRAQ